MKPLKFDPDLIGAITGDEKSKTWRIDDEKGIDVNDRLSLRDPSGAEFGQASVDWVKRTTIRRLSEEDRRGHGYYGSEDAIVESMQGYYDQEVTPHTVIKVISFTLLWERARTCPECDQRNSPNREACIGCGAALHPDPEVPSPEEEGDG